MEPGALALGAPWNPLLRLTVRGQRTLPGRPVIVEGFRLLPHLVAPLVESAPRRAVWLLPTPGFRLAAFRSRGALWDIAGRTGDPPRALAKLLERDALFTDRVAAEAEALGLQRVRVDSSLGEDDLARRVGDLLGL